LAACGDRGSSAGEEQRGRLVVRESVFGAYAEGAITYLQLAHNSAGNVLTLRGMRNISTDPEKKRLLLDRELVPGDYELTVWYTSCGVVDCTGVGAEMEEVQEATASPSNCRLHTKVTPMATTTLDVRAGYEGEPGPCRITAA
jgi:hypothetical protein